MKMIPRKQSTDGVVAYKMIPTVFESLINSVICNFPLHLGREDISCTPVCSHVPCIVLLQPDAGSNFGLLNHNQLNLEHVSLELELVGGTR